MTTEPSNREGYRPEWLALEDASGGRYVMTGDWSIDVPTFDAVFAAFAKQWPQLPEEMEVWDEKTDSQHEGLDVRIYKPASDTPLPLMIFYPGGGYIAGNLDTEDAHCRIFAAKVPCLVISVNYPKIPNVKLDGIISAASLAVPWCHKKARKLGDNPTKTILTGGSAGAMLAAQVAYRFMSEGDHTSVTGLVLLFAVTLRRSQNSTIGYNRPEEASFIEYDGKYKDIYTAWEENGNAGTPVFGMELAKFMWSHYDIDFDSPRHLVCLADDLSKFPPSYIVTAEKDCFRDDGKVLDVMLRESGVRSKLDHYEGLPHYFTPSRPWLLRVR
ncbi:hypothetical protein H2200_012071 [Cladophialophora chaetospira]|uniref:Alpha/beta hydrolase fold-3 domain-containing protein n=1 Tax=Cladophialophora chaetospira TaxID=386627 RepID=A0AA38WY65_9EURO|nr:hypothetical protein H2200_012071 [Cladophialophora chaetospira]